MESGEKFNVGTGLSDKQRRAPPKIGAIITYRFQELTRDSVPRFVLIYMDIMGKADALLYACRFPSFIGVPIDKDEPKNAEIPEHRKAGAKPNSTAE